MKYVGGLVMDYWSVVFAKRFDAQEPEMQQTFFLIIVLSKIL